VINYNDAHADLEKPEGYEAQTGLIKAAAALDRDTDPDYTKRLDGYRKHARSVLTATMNAHGLDAFIFPGLAYIASSKAGWPQVIAPMGFLPDDVETKHELNKETGQPFPVELVSLAVLEALTFRSTWSQYPGQPIGLTFGAEAYSEAKLLSFGE
jgi:Asp-tRNA(Asn)/Glu-tRNA(Gln) amidotransferase A subunit family amidase